MNTYRPRPSEPENGGALKGRNDGHHRMEVVQIYQTLFQTASSTIYKICSQIETTVYSKLNKHWLRRCPYTK